MNPKTLVVWVALLGACSDGTTGSTGAPSSGPAAKPTPGSSAAPDKGSPPFDAKLVAEPKYKLGEDAAVTVQIDAKDGYHVNPEYPMKFTLGAPADGVEYPTPVVKDVKRAETHATITVPFKPTAAGQKKIGGECALSVCTDERCVIEKVPLEVTVVVE